MSTTPRTDAVQFLDQSDYHDPSAVDWFVRADFARELETQLDAALAELGKMFLSAAETADRNVELRRRAEKAEAKIITARSALSRIANSDYRGNRSTESQIAFAALEEIK